MKSLSKVSELFLDVPYRCGCSNSRCRCSGSHHFGREDALGNNTENKFKTNSFTK
jgi:hypothetical protein